MGKICLKQYHNHHECCETSNIVTFSQIQIFKIWDLSITSLGLGAQCVGGGTTHIPIEVIWLDIQTVVGDTVKELKMFEKQSGGHSTF